VLVALQLLHCTPHKQLLARTGSNATLLSVGLDFRVYHAPKSLSSFACRHLRLFLWLVKRSFSVHFAHNRIRLTPAFSWRQKYEFIIFYPLCQALLAAFCVCLLLAPQQFLANSGGQQKGKQRQEAGACISRQPSYL
jgi:hypothetical protein